MWQCLAKTPFWMQWTNMWCIKPMKNWNDLSVLVIALDCQCGFLDVWCSLGFSNLTVFTLVQLVFVAGSFRKKSFGDGIFVHFAQSTEHLLFPLIFITVLQIINFAFSNFCFSVPACLAVTEVLSLSLICTHAYTHACTHTHTHICVRTHTHTHTEKMASRT